MISRRRFIAMSASAVAGVTALGAVAIAKEGLKPFIRQGKAMGAIATMQLYHEDEQQAQAIMSQCFAEVDRLENICSLYREGSELVTLNKQGYITAPSQELLELLTFAKQYGDITNGAFDVSVQPVWRFLQVHFEQYQGVLPDRAMLQSQLDKVDYRKIDVGDSEIRLAPAMELTFNGIAQGFMTDKVTEMLRKHGCDDVLVNIGEFYGSGTHADGREWQVGVKDVANEGELYDVVRLHNRAMASSAPSGMMLDEKVGVSHLLHPQDGLTKIYPSSVTVIADKAVEADALSTAFSVMEQKDIDRVREMLPEIDVLQQNQII